LQFLTHTIKQGLSILLEFGVPVTFDTTLDDCPEVKAAVESLDLKTRLATQEQ
jgi:hypothetical protein